MGICGMALTLGGVEVYRWNKYEMTTILPSGYTPVEYIRSSGAQYVNTGVTPNNTTVIEAKIGASNGHFFAAIPSASSGRFGIYALQNGRFDIAFGSSGYIGGIVSGATYPAEITFKNGSLTVNGVTKTFTTQGAFTSASKLPLFAEGTSASSGEVYYWKDYNNGSLVRDLIPCKNASGAVGLYDLVNGVFYANAGSGTFTAGAEVENIVKGDLIEEVKSLNSNAYPDGGVQDGYYYERVA